MRWNLRRTLAAGAALTILGVGVPAVAAYSEDDPRSCNDLLGDDTPAFVVCKWLAKPDEAREVAMFWLQNDGQNMKDAGPLDVNVVDCQAPGTSCPEIEDEGVTGGEGDSLPEDYADPTAPPECDPPGGECFVDPAKLRVGAEEVQAAARTTEGQALATAKDAGLRVWLDTELADDWKAGKERFTAEVKRIAALAAQQGVTGIRFSSQLGYNDPDITTAEEARAFVADASRALRLAVPGRKLAVHTLVPAFGCGANDACKAEMAEKYPLLAPDLVGSYVTSGAVDQIALDSGLVSNAYAPWKITAEEALRNQWIQVRARAWDAYAHVAAEDATLTGVGGSSLTAEQAAETIAERVSRPLMDDGAETVTLWSRWQGADGQVRRVLGAGLANTPTWDQLTKLDAVKPRLATLYDPAAPEVDVATDLKKLAEVFSQVYLTVA